VEIFLQGSYANSTNIYGDSDVDVVVLYRDTFYFDWSALTAAERQLHEVSFTSATYQWPQLRDETLAALRSHFGNGAVTPGKKAIKVQTGTGRLAADVVPAMQFRRYATFVDPKNLTAHWGIQLFDSAGNAIVNYPKYHIERGEGKNQENRTGGQYKQTVRVFKNFRNYLVGKGLLAQGIAPSYFVECALHNVPDSLFMGNLNDTLPAILNHLLNTPSADFLCQNGVTRLIGTGSTQWPVANFGAFVEAGISGWNNW